MVQSKQFSIYVYSQKDLAKSYSQISTKYLQTYNIPTGIIIFRREVQHYVDAETIYFRKTLWSYSSYLMEETYISGLEIQQQSLEFFISFSKIYIFERGLAISFWVHVFHISSRVINFQDIYFTISNCEKWASFLENQIPIFFEEQ